MKLSKIFMISVTIILLTLSYACQDDESDEGPEAQDCSTTRSYMSDVVPIINKSCAIENCHVDGFINGDYTGYEQLKAQHDRGVLKTRIESGSMPPTNSSGPKTLTDSEKNTILCWIEDGAPEN